jgi:predicted nucleic acid-binding Zn ribbon protein
MVWPTEAIMPLCSTCQRLNPAGVHHCLQCGSALRLTNVVAQAEDSWRLRARERRRNHAITGMLLIALQAVILGAPLGWLVSAAGGGLLIGAAIGAGFSLVLALIGWVFGSGSLLSAVLIGMGSGLLPGAIMGWHVEHDS